MRKDKGAIPVNNFGDDLNPVISIERVSFDRLPAFGDWEQPERHDRHSFFLVESGSVTIEIDFQQYEIQAPSLIYMHPDQVHRIIGFENVTVNSWAITNEHLKPGYLKLLEAVTPAAPLLLNPERLLLLSEATTLCLKFSERKNHHLYQDLLIDQSNALIGLVISFFLESSVPVDQSSRAEFFTKAFREALATHFTTLKRPAQYAGILHLSVPYLNECVKNATGHSVSYHIRQRVMLEAKRLLYHSRQSLKEIAAVLGYDDYAYFSRLFTSVTGLSPQAFRHKNCD